MTAPSIHRLWHELARQIRVTPDAPKWLRELMSGLHSDSDIPKGVELTMALVAIDAVLLRSYEHKPFFERTRPKLYAHFVRLRAELGWDITSDEYLEAAAQRAKYDAIAHYAGRALLRVDLTYKEVVEELDYTQKQRFWVVPDTLEIVLTETGV